METKVLERGSIKLAGEGHGQLEGYASTFGTAQGPFDRVGEAVVRGAFANTLAAFKSAGFVAWGHKWDALPIASVTDAYEDHYGLYIKADFHSHTQAQDARRLVLERTSRGKQKSSMSIGYQVLKDERVPGGRLLKELELYEVSIVTQPADPRAQIMSAKHAGYGHMANLTDMQKRVIQALLAKNMADLDREKAERRLEVLKALRKMGVNPASLSRTRGY